MKIHHIAIWVKDLEKMKQFYINFFAGKSGEKYYNKKTEFQSYFISFESGSRLEIMTKPDILEQYTDKQRTGYTHMAFSVGSKEAVDDLTERLRVNGYRVISEPRTTGDGYYESTVLDPENNRIEIVQ
ncbi:MAG: VOC family protein [Clostridia bacterium]|nr:VOC family protein [Clostridia bacterium]